MKEFFITVFGVLVINCLVNSFCFWAGFFQEIPPFPYPAGINDVYETKTGCKRVDQVYPEINITKDSRPSTFITEVTADGDRCNAEFPLGANN